MEKLEIEGVVIRYKSVLDLNQKVKRVLSRLTSQKERYLKEMKRLKKREKTLKKFLGYKENNPEKVPHVLQTIDR